MNYITEQPCEDCGEVHGKEFTRHTTTKYVTVKLTEDQARWVLKSTEDEVWRRATATQQAWMQRLRNKIINNWPKSQE